MIIAVATLSNGVIFTRYLLPRDETDTGGPIVPVARSNALYLRTMDRRYGGHVEKADPWLLRHS